MAWRDWASDRLRFFFAEEPMSAPSPQPSGASEPPVTLTPVAFPLPRSLFPFRLGFNLFDHRLGILFPFLCFGVGICALLL
ncbi:hypothetical protein BHE74_00037111 [Ensete ventricosum]|uniref:Uncharacterized protein n=1 Tax=Ensete ventricosum TaxID=4639 RepID=A0A426YTW8_ENSVE|nr:hypothetical protein B296_00048643 [Ensete ventricosum]RWW56182.1 hypothetical protein BHE74_00037111 [Ensete ventricosum]RZR93841.1 hypothetical protein BHM03_00022419 [Ensete ventricosum]